MRCCGNWLKGCLRALLGGLLLVALAAQATDLSVRNVHLVATDDGYSVSADFNINFNSRLEEAVNRGVVLYFAAEFELSHSRWYWLDEQIVQRRRTFRLSYHALTRQYRLSTGALHQSYATLDEALSVIGRLRNWQVIEKGEVRINETYLAALRMRLDLTQMAKTFQVSALANRDWNLASDWQRWTFVPADAVLSAQAGAPAGPAATSPAALPPAQAPPAVPPPAPSTPAGTGAAAASGDGK